MKIIILLIISTLLNIVSAFFILKMKGVLKMFMFDENNPMVVSCLMAIKLYGMKVEDITNLCGLRDVVIGILEKETEEQK